MRFRSVFSALVVASMLAVEPVSACTIEKPLKLTDVKRADVVVVGRVTNYRIILDEKARRERKAMLARHNSWPPDVREYLTRQTHFAGDRERFDIVVDDVLKGKAPRRLSVSWQAGMLSGLPSTMTSEPQLIALQTVSPGELEIMQDPCSPEFMFPANSKLATDVRWIIFRQGFGLPG